MKFRRFTLLLAWSMILLLVLAACDDAPPTPMATLPAAPVVVQSTATDAPSSTMPTITAVPDTATPAVPNDEDLGILGVATSAPPTAPPQPVAAAPPTTSSAPESPAGAAGAAGCTLPSGWTTYSVVAGDTLNRIAQRVGSSVAELTAANCLADANTLAVGQVLYVPGGAAAADDAAPPPAADSAASTTGQGTGEDSQPVPPAAEAPVVEAATEEVVSGPRILNFASGIGSVESGDGVSVDLYWTVENAATVVIYPWPGAARMLDTSAAVRVPLAGTRFFPVGTHQRDQIGFTLVATDADGQTAQADVTVRIRQPGDPVQEDPLPPDSGDILIRSFDATPRQVDRGGAVTVTWDVTNTAGIVIMAIGQEPRSPRRLAFDLPASGSTTVYIPVERNFLRGASLLLAPVNNFGRQVAQASGVPTTLGISVQCPYTYFFTPPDDTCPLDPPQETTALVQRFERGYLLWRADTGSIYLLRGSNGTWSAMLDTYSGGEISFAEPAPAGLQLPQGRFGHLWVNDTTVRAELGWATAAAQSYTMTYQQYLAPRYPSFDRLYFTVPGGRVGYFAGPTWQIP